ncbi:hypothetical protein CBW46_012130 [Paenibacillus xerothermodurans]|uniref:RNA polymerase sigma-70 region 2 domain-containing protein n=1 Tax=Paenibacillus xerothermodurans TaxID=1977292 RepID=A0A2W1N7Z6_PAEXE|nr:hypothetical protein CBW46_012130 [Paenibacillus xerothermodurans]
MRTYSKKFFALGVTQEDFYPAGCVGLWMALVKFETDKGSFGPFARLHMKNAMISVLKQTTRKKQKILNHCQPLLEAAHDDDSRRPLIDLMPDEKSAQPEQYVLEHEQVTAQQQRLQHFLSKLTHTERTVGHFLPAGLLIYRNRG